VCECFDVNFAPNSSNCHRSHLHNGVPRDFQDVFTVTQPQMFPDIQCHVGALSFTTCLLIS